MNKLDCVFVLEKNLENTKELVLIPRLRVHIIEICVENKTILCD